MRGSWVFLAAQHGYQFGVPMEREDRRHTERAGRRFAPVPEPGVVLPPGYRLWLDPDLLVLPRDDGSTVAAFSALGADPEEVERAAREDYRRSGEDAG